VTADGRPASARDTAGRLVEAEQKLKDLLTVYTDKHPEVGILEAEIAELQQRRNRELEALRQGDPEAVVSTGASANPVYQSIQLALNQANLQIASLRGEIAQRDRKIAELRKVVQTVPEVEAELSRLNRDYDVTKAQYLALLERMEQAKLGQSAEATKSGVILEVLDPPMASFEPVAPRRPVLISLVLLAGIGAGAALAYLLSKLNPVFVHSRDLEKITGHEVLGVVSLTTFETYQATARKAYYRYAALAVALLLTFLVVLIFSQRVRDLIAAA
jgi:polysaccharide chain length determinant protein (PEP-CTERM system associated)